MTHLTKTTKTSLNLRNFNDLSFQETYKKVKEFLNFVGYWPSENVSKTTIINYAVLTIFIICAIIKNTTAPDHRSFSDALTHSNGMALVNVYLTVLIFRGSEFWNLSSKLDEDMKRYMNDEESHPVIKAGIELKLSIKIFGVIFVPATLLKFIQPLATILYFYIFGDVNQINFSPPMAFPILWKPSVTTMLESITTTFLLTGLAGSMLVFMVMTLYLCSQFNGLKYTLLNEKSPGQNISNGIFLDNCIKRHSELIRFCINFVFLLFFYVWLYDVRLLTIRFLVKTVANFQSVRR